MSAELADKPDLALREAVRESGLLMHCGGAFIVSNTGNAAQEPLRKLVIDLLQVSTVQYMHLVKRANKSSSPLTCRSPTIHANRAIAGERRDQEVGGHECGKFRGAALHRQGLCEDHERAVHL